MIVNIVYLLEADGFHPRRVANTHGGEFHGRCPRCGGDDRLVAWPDRDKEGGSYWCRQCNTGGDLIHYCRDVRKMSFPEACQFVGRELPARPSYLSGRKGNASSTQHRVAPARQNVTSVVDPDLWQSKAKNLVDEAGYYLWTYEKDRWLKWLTAVRGLSEGTIKVASLGVLLMGRFPEPEPWGLKPEFKPNGDKKKLWLPQAHTIPLVEQEKVLRIKFRRPKSAGDPRYLFLRGSHPAARVVNPQSSVFAIVENELDGLLLAQEGTSLGLGVIALGSASIQPGSLKPEVQAALKNAACILVCLDFDKGQGEGDKGAWAGGKAAQTWLRQFPQAIRWVPATGKDVGEMWNAGKSIKTWIEIGLERALKPKV